MRRSRGRDFTLGELLSRKSRQNSSQERNESNLNISQGDLSLNSQGQIPEPEISLFDENNNVDHGEPISI